MVGYSTGGTLAVQYVVEAIDDPSLPRASRLILFSPAIGVTAFGVFASWNKVLSFLPYFEQFRWESIVPEYDPYKYNSFAKNAGDQIYGLTGVLNRQLEQLDRSGRMGELPPVLSFQSLVDATVLTRETVERLFDRLEGPGSELVLFDVNRASALEEFMGPTDRKLLERLETDSEVPYAITLITNASPTALEVTERRRGPGELTAAVRALDSSWPRQVYSLSHVAIPFRPDDPLYGETPIEPDRPSLGALSPRGEKGQLPVPLDQLMRLRYNPFFAYLEMRLRQTVGGPGG